MERAEKSFWLAMAALVLLFLACTIARGKVGAALPLPPLEVARCLPSHSICAEAAKFTRENYVAILKCYGREDDHELDWGMLPHVDCAWYSREAWRLAEAATDERQDDRSRRLALGELIGQVGWRAVLTGTLPDLIPWVEPWPR